MDKRLPFHTSLSNKVTNLEFLVIPIGKHNPKHNSRKSQNKKRHIIKKAKFIQKNNQNYQINTKEDDEIDPVKVFNQVTDLMRTTRDHSFYLALIDWFFESIEIIDPDYSQKTKVILNQQQFEEFLNYFSNSINSALIYQLNQFPAEMDFIIHKFYEEYHQLKMKSIEREPFYYGLKYLLYYYKMVSKNYDLSLEKANYLLRDKRCVKNLFSFQNFCYANAAIQKYRIIVDMVDNVQLPCTKLDEKQLSNPEIFFNFYFPIKKWQIKSEIRNDYRIYSQRLSIIVNPVWSTSTFFERIYANMILAPMDPTMKNIKIIDPTLTFDYFKKIEKILIKELDFTALEFSSIITAFFNVFNGININMDNNNQPMLAYFVFPIHSNQSNALVKYVKDIYNSPNRPKNNLSNKITDIDSKNKILKFLKLFSLNSSTINLEKDLFSQEIIPFALEFSPNEYFISSMQFLTAFSEFLYHFGKKTGSYANYKGKDFEKWMKYMLNPVIPHVCTRLLLENVEIANKNKTDIDVAIKYENILFIVECKAYSRINYQKSFKLVEIEKNMDKIEYNIAEIDSIADWCQYPDNLNKVIKKINLKMEGKHFIEKSSIEYIVPVLATISPEFLLKNESIGMLDSELKIPRCCTLREMITFFKKLKQNSSLKQKIKTAPYTRRVKK